VHARINVNELDHDNGDEVLASSPSAFFHDSIDLYISTPSFQIAKIMCINRAAEQQNSTL